MTAERVFPQPVRPLGLESASRTTREEVLHHLQSLLVQKVKDLQNRQRLKVSFSASKTMRQLIIDVLTVAREAGKEGPVSQHLVGAKLEMRFPNVPIESRTFSAADASAQRPGDYAIGDTAFHVTTAPGAALFDKCKKNLADGLRVYVLVPERKLATARDLGDDACPERITAESLESFLSQNIEEMAEFQAQNLRSSFRMLLETYNTRVDAAEFDKSLLFEFPKNL